MPLGVGSNLATGVGVRVGLGRGVAVTRRVGGGVGRGVDVGSGVAVGARVGSGVGVGVGSGVGVAVGSGVEVGSGVFVGRGVAVAVGLGVGVSGSAVEVGSSDSTESSGSPSEPQAIVRNRTKTNAMVPTVANPEGSVRFDFICHSLVQISVDCATASCLKRSARRVKDAYYHTIPIVVHNCNRLVLTHRSIPHLVGEITIRKVQGVKWE